MSEKPGSPLFQLSDAGCSSSKVLLFPCSGGSNVGQIANTVAVKLTTEGLGKIFCLAGVGAHDSGMLSAAKLACRVVSIDGCPVACSRRTLEHAQVTVTDAFLLTDLGVGKNKDFSLQEQDIDSVYRQIVECLENNSVST